MRAYIFAMIITCAVLFLAACSMRVDVSPRFPPRMHFRLDEAPGTPTQPAQIVTRTVVITAAQTVPWWMLGVHPTSAATTSLTSTIAIAEPRFIELCKIERLFGLPDMLDLAGAVPLYALMRPVTATTFMTSEYGFPVYDPAIQPTLFSWADIPAEESDECRTDQPVLWLETHYTPTIDGSVNVSAPITIASLSIPVQNVCPVPKNTTFRALMSENPASWADLIVVKRPDDGSIHMIRMQPMPPGCVDDSGGGSAFKRAFCGRLSTRTAYGRIVRFMVGCR